MHQLILSCGRRSSPTAERGEWRRVLFTPADAQRGEQWLPCARAGRWPLQVEGLEHTALAHRVRQRGHLRAPAQMSSQLRARPISRDVLRLIQPKVELARVADCGAEHREEAADG